MKRLNRIPSGREPIYLLVMAVIMFLFSLFMAPAVFLALSIATASVGVLLFSRRRERALKYTKIDVSNLLPRVEQLIAAGVIPYEPLAHSTFLASMCESEDQFLVPLALVQMVISILSLAYVSASPRSSYILASTYSSLYQCVLCARAEDVE